MVQPAERTVKARAAGPGPSAVKKADTARLLDCNRNADNIGDHQRSTGSSEHNRVRKRLSDRKGS